MIKVQEIKPKSQIGGFGEIPMKNSPLNPGTIFVLAFTIGIIIV